MHNVVFITCQLAGKPGRTVIMYNRHAVLIVRPNPLSRPLLPGGAAEPADAGSAREGVPGPAAVDDAPAVPRAGGAVPDTLLHGTGT